MSTLSQSIPNFLSGISQQPDNRKRPGQVRDAVNTFPDFALGMLKRPGGKFVSKLHGASTSGKWFEILRDATEKYIAQYDDNVFRVWDLDGDTRMVDMGANTGVPGTCNTVTVKTASDAFNDAVADVAAKLALLQAAEATLAETKAGQKPTISVLFDTTFTYTQKVEESVTTGIIQLNDGVYLVKNANTVVSNAATLPAGFALGTERTDEHPYAASKQIRIYEINQTIAATHTAAQLTAATTAYTTAKTNYDNAVTTRDSARTTYDTAVANCAITSIPSNGYLNGATADDIELLTVNDSVFVLNKKKEVAMTADETHSSGLDQFRAHVLITVVANSATYTVTINGTAVSKNASTSGANASNTAVRIQDQINNDATMQSAGITALAIGPGIHITGTSAFDISVASTTGTGGIVALTDTVSDISTLPLEAKNGYVVQVINSADIDVDDMYLEFLTDSGSATGKGQWYETTKPGIAYKFDPLTMPHVLVSNADQTFTFKAPTVLVDGVEESAWNERIVGDEETNPKPSFVGSKIDHIFFYRNRLGFLSGQNVVLAKAGDVYNFWNTTAQTSTDDDPIDISVAGKKPVFLHYVQPTSVGLVLYSAVEQFLLTTDSDILSPKSAKVNTMSNYECDENVEAVSLGISQAFISKTPLFTRLFELNDIAQNTPPLMSDITNIVPELVPATIDSLKASPGLSLVSLGETGKSTLYQYRFLNRTREQRVVNSWYKWDLTGTLLTQFFDNNTFYAVVKSGSDVYVQSFDVSQSNEQGYLSLPTGEKTDVCLDLFNINPHRTYDDVADKTTVSLPYDSVSGKTLNLLILGEFGSIYTPTISGPPGSQTIQLDGDYRGKDLIIGYGYDMTVDLPKLFRYVPTANDIKNDDVSSLIIHRLKFKMGLSGPVDYKVSITGIDPFTKDVTVTMPQQYTLNNVNMQANSTHVVPIYQRNENLAVQIIGNTPFPVSLLGLDWEGKLNQRFYRRG